MSEATVERNRHALLIANDEYDDPGFRALVSPDMDAAALAGVLEDAGIGDFTVRVLRNGTVDTVRRAVEDFFADRAAADVLVMHFSCHGVKDPGGELYLAMRDTLPKRLASTGLPAAFVSEQMAASRARQVVLLLDCCFGGAFERGILARSGDDVQVLDAFAAQQAEPTVRGRWVITASTATQYAFEEGELTSHDERPSLFTGAVVDALKTGEADRDGDGWVGLNELFAYVSEDVQGHRHDQTPQLWAFGSQGDMHLARSRLRRVVATPLEAELANALRSSLTATRLGLVPIFREQMLGADLGAALAAWQALRQLGSDDSKMVSDAAEAALTAMALRISPAAVELSPTMPAVDLHLMGPPLAVAVAARPEAPWLEVEYVEDAIRVRATTLQETGRRSGVLRLTGPIGTTPVPVTVEGMSAGRHEPTPEPGKNRSRRTMRVPAWAWAPGLALTVAVLVAAAVWLLPSRAPAPSATDTSGAPAALPQGPPLSDDVLVWAARTGGGWGLRTGAAFGTAVDLVDQPNVDETWPTISPDRRTVAYLAATGDATALRVAASDGTKGHPLQTKQSDCSPSGRAAWRPDGTALALACQAHGASKECGVCIVNLQGAVIGNVDPKHTVAAPGWSPDGNYVVYARRNRAVVEGRPGSSIWAAPADGSGSPIRLTRDPTVDVVPAVSPLLVHGRYLVAFQRHAANGKTGIWLVTVTSGTVTRVSAAHPLEVNDPQRSNHDPTWSPSGRLLAFSRGGRLVQTDPRNDPGHFQLLFPSEHGRSNFKADWGAP